MLVAKQPLHRAEVYWVPLPARGWCCPVDGNNAHALTAKQENTLETKKIKNKTKSLNEIKLDQHNCILKHSRKVISCQTCLGVFVQSLYLINEHLTYLCYHFITILKATSNFQKSLWKLRLRPSLLLKVVSNCDVADLTCLTASDNLWALELSSEDESWGMFYQLTFGFTFIWPKPQVFHFNHLLSHSLSCPLFPYHCHVRPQPKLTEPSPLL